MQTARYTRTVDGFDVAYFIAGEGLTLIRTPILWNHVSRQWVPEILGQTFDALSERFRLVLYDARGQGLSTRGLPESHSIEDYVLDLSSVADRVAERFILMGWSFGCATAIKFAVEHPERVIALVLWEYKDLSEQTDALKRLAAEDWHYFVETTARSGFPEFDAYKVKEVLFDAMTQADHVKQWEAFHSISADDLLRQVRVPALFVASRIGTRPGSGEHDAVRGAAMIPGAQLVFFEGRDGFKTGGDGSAPQPVQATESFIRRLLEDKEQGSQAVSEIGAWSDVARLSAREVQILRLLATGESNQEIANDLSISVRTVERHVANIYAKIGTNSRAQASVFAVRQGLA